MKQSQRAKRYKMTTSTQIVKLPIEFKITGTIVLTGYNKDGSDKRETHYHCSAFLGRMKLADVGYACGFTSRTAAIYAAKNEIKSMFPIK